MGEPVKAEIILYQSEGANIPVQVRYMNKTLWLPQREIADLFGTSKQTISYHMGNIFGDGELDKEGSCQRNFDNCLPIRGRFLKTGEAGIRRMTLHVI